ncbi:MAG: helix-turn-helix transcriptional regulator [Saprospiraceae bacterium]|nr:helix-turn-helix transcriptional regulator [Saprospiraceae bacterium]
MLRIPALILCCFYFSGIDALGQVQVNGQLILDSTWQRMVFACPLGSMEDMYKCSPQMIMASGPVDSLGYFQLDLPTSNFPRLIRLHVTKVDAPPAMLIVGGRQENHGFLAIAPELSAIQLSTSTKDRIFPHFSGEDPLNRSLSMVDSIVRFWSGQHAALKNESDQYEARSKMIDALYNSAEMSESPLTKVYALYLADQGFNHDEVVLRLEEAATNHPDFPYLITSLPERSQGSSRVLLALLLLAIPAGSYWFYMRWSQVRKQVKVNQLSPQERKVAQLLYAGKSNKEIAEVLHVEVSTVKSHTNRIFNKLKISSRNEVRRFGHLIL